MVAIKAMTIAKINRIIDISLKTTKSIFLMAYPSLNVIDDEWYFHESKIARNPERDVSALTYAHAMIPLMNSMYFIEFESDFIEMY